MRVLLIGAGEAGVLVARETRESSRPRPAAGRLPRRRPAQDRHEHPRAAGARHDRRGRARSPQRKRVKRALITIANAPGQQIRRITELCRDAGLETKIIPGIYEIVGGKVNLSRIREVAIEDLLGREPVQLDEGDRRRVDPRPRRAGHRRRRQHRLGAVPADLPVRPERLVLVEQAENALFEIHRELAAAFPHVADRAAHRRHLRRDAHGADLRRATSPDVVFHAAAHKHVPMMEWNPGEAVKNNVVGTRTVADLARSLRRRALRHDLDRQGREPDVGHGRDQAGRRDLRPGALAAQSRRGSSRCASATCSARAGSVIPIFQRADRARAGRSPSRTPR